MPEYEYDELHPSKRVKVIYEDASLTIKPLGKSRTKDPVQPPPPSPKIEVPSGMNTNRFSRFSRESIQAIIAAAAKEAAAAEAAAAASVEQTKPSESGSGSRKKQKAPKKGSTPEEKEANREKRLLKLVGAVVVKCMSKYSKSMDHDLFKKHAKEVCAFTLQPSRTCTDTFSTTQLTQIIADKEKKSSSYKEWKLDQLSDEKVTKIKKFAKEYIAKVLRRLEKSGHRPRSSSSSIIQATSSPSLDTSNSAEGDSVTADVSMLVEETMDMDPDTDGEEEEDEGDGDGEGQIMENRLAGLTGFLGTTPPEPMVVDEYHDSNGQPSDPRRRPPHRDSEWAPRSHYVNGVGMS